MALSVNGKVAMNGVRRPSTMQHCHALTLVALSFLAETAQGSTCKPQGYANPKVEKSTKPAFPDIVRMFLERSREVTRWCSSKLTRVGMAEQAVEDGVETGEASGWPVVEVASARVGSVGSGSSLTRE